MRRLMLAWTLLALVLLGLGLSASTGMTVTGQLSATDQEADEGYFAIGADTMIVAKPGSDLHQWLRNHSGRRLKVTLDLVDASE